MHVFPLTQVLSFLGVHCWPAKERTIVDIPVLGHSGCSGFIGGFSNLQPLTMMHRLSPLLSIPSEPACMADLTMCALCGINICTVSGQGWYISQCCPLSTTRRKRHLLSSSDMVPSFPPPGSPIRANRSWITSSFDRGCQASKVVLDCERRSRILPNSPICAYRSSCPLLTRDKTDSRLLSTKH